jgi:tetratricopeptide (TPR) repeat protein
MDRLLHGVRTRLGESLKQIDTSSQPLEKATTANLDALRALSQAADLERDGDLDGAGRLLRFAIELDPNFALAYVRLGSVLLQLESYPDSRAALMKSLAFEGRLTDRERFYVRALLAEFDDPQTALNEWRAFASLYPDYGTGQNNIGNVASSSFHDYPAAEAAYTKAAVPRNPLLNDTLASLAYVLLAQEKLDEAERKFRAAYALSPSPEFFGLSGMLVAGGRLDEAASYLDSVARQPAAVEVERVMRRATLKVARGQVGDAVALLEAELPSISQVSSPNARWRAQAALVALQVDQNMTGAAQAMLARHIGDLLSQPSRGDGRSSIMEEILYAAAWAARLGLAKEATDALTVAANEGALDRFPVRRRLAAVVQAELDLRSGRPEVALARLQGAGGNELWEWHEVRARAFRAQSDVPGEVAELRWLASHRGLAQAQWTDQLLGQQARTLALLRAGERLAAIGPRT